MKIVQINKSQLNIFSSAQKQAQFLQSYEWGEFQEEVGNKVLRIGIEEDGKIEFVASITKKKLPGVNKGYLYAPRISFDNINSEQTEYLLKEIEKVAKIENAIFLRFDPISKSKIENRKSKIVRTIDVQPSKTSVLDIGRSEDELLKNMRQKTRYNIRLSEKKGVKVREASDARKDFEAFWQIMEETKERDEFRLHSKEYYRKMLRVKLVKLYLAEYEDDVIAGNIVGFYGDMATYIHGASSNKYRNVMAPYALQWQTIKLAKQSGYKYYDFNGIDKKKWPGVTRFKRGFGGEEINYPGTFDLVFNKKWYKAYKIIRRLRRMV